MKGKKTMSSKSMGGSKKLGGIKTAFGGAVYTGKK
jgi:hypothetical protein